MTLKLMTLQHPRYDRCTDMSITFKETLGILLIQGEQLSGSFADLGKSELDPPHFSLVPQSILTYGD